MKNATRIDWLLHCILWAGNELLLCVKSIVINKKPHLCGGVRSEYVSGVERQQFPSTLRAFNNDSVLTDIRNTTPRLKYFSMIEMSQFCL